MLSKKRKPSAAAKQALSRFFVKPKKAETKPKERGSKVLFDNADFGTQDNLEST
ncbi:hypothetical protein FBZ84_12660 [Azospirillum baldaniorum]|nr:hypothetical protein FBZ84_12660 [Azospirillum baldaniorum]